MAEALAVATGIAEVSRDICFSFLFDCRNGVEEGHGRVALGRGGEIEGSLGEMEAAFGEADIVESLRTGHDDSHGVGVGQADILTGQDDHAPENEAGVFAGVDHAGHPVERGIRVEAAEALYKGADRVVVDVAFLIIEHGTPLDAFFGHFACDVDGAIRREQGWFRRPVRGH